MPSTLNDSEELSLHKIRAAIQSGKLPSFPVTRTFKVPVEYFTNVRVKDESTNETGTHKDRMAWEVVTAYLAILEAKELGAHSLPLPFFSVISAGSAALAVQTQLRKYDLPNLKVLADKGLHSEAASYLKSIGCEVYSTDLSERVLLTTDILELTDNVDGFDITSSSVLEPNLRFYDWMSYEILNENPEYVFMPYGTGQLYENVLNIGKLILTTPEPDEVYTGERQAISRCNFIGATSNDPNTRAEKLYAPFRPFAQSSPDWVKLFVLEGYCGAESRIEEIDEEYIVKGSEIFASQKIDTEYSAAAGIGLLYQLKERIPQDARILVVNTGKARIPLAQAP